MTLHLTGVLKCALTCHSCPVPYPAGRVSDVPPECVDIFGASSGSWGYHAPGTETERSGTSLITLFFGSGWMLRISTSKLAAVFQFVRNQVYCNTVFPSSYLLYSSPDSKGSTGEDVFVMSVSVDRLSSRRTHSDDVLLGDTSRKLLNTF